MDANSIKGFHIEPTNKCTLKCPGCARTRFRNSFSKYWTNQDLDIDSLFKFLDIDLNNKSLLFCGVYGDSIYHANFIDMIKESKSQGANVSITTNGSYKSLDWWKSLVSLLSPSDEIIFSVDGDPSNFNQYRINGDWQSIETGMKVVGSTDVKSTWRYILFAYNLNSIDTAKNIAQNLNITNFEVATSHRYDEVTEEYKPAEEKFLHKKYTPQSMFKKDTSNNVSVDPKCKDNQTHFISAQGFYSPCCFIADHRFYYKTRFAKNQNLYDISKTTISQILSEPEVVDFYNNLNLHSVCKFNCPSCS